MSEAEGDRAAQGRSRKAEGKGPQPEAAKPEGKVDKAGPKGPPPAAAKPEGKVAPAVPATAPPAGKKAPWVIVAIDDKKEILDQIKDYFEDEEVTIGGRPVIIEASNQFSAAAALLEQRRVDAAVFDVFQGKPEDGVAAGLEVLANWQKIGFAPVIFYTALPESAGVQNCLGAFVSAVKKDDGVKALHGALERIFGTRIPDVHRELRRHIDRALSEHMWGFVSSNWSKHLDALKDQSDVVHLLVQRLAADLTRRGVGRILEEVYPGAGHGDLVDGLVRATEFYVKPPVGKDPQLGDLRRVTIDGKKVLVAVLWPTCDMVTGRRKVDRVLCAELLPLDKQEEITTWAKKPDDSNVQGKVKNLLKNRRASSQDERFHYLPAAWDIPDSVVDFLETHRIPIADLEKADCIATLASPFAESLNARYVRYVSRLGTPDLDYDDVLTRLKKGLPKGTAPEGKVK